MNNKINVTWKSSQEQLDKRIEFFQLFKNTPIPDNELLLNIGVYINRQTWGRLLYMHELYQKIINVHGSIFEFGVRWGQNLCLFENFRGMYEPYNYNRKIVGFDTFSGFPHIDPLDGGHAIIMEGGYNVTDGYQQHLEKVMDFHESESPISHIKKYELVCGDACITLPNYLKEHPETTIALAYFDFDIYKSTKECLNAIKPYLVKGAVVGFDEIGLDTMPGETIAVREVLGNVEFRRMPNNPHTCYIIW